MLSKKSIANRFTVRLGKNNEEFFRGFLKNEPDIDIKNKSGGVNLIMARYFLYEKYADFINSLENLIRKGK